MNMMATNHARVTNPRWIAENIVIQHHPNGSASIECITCGCSPLTQRELADAIGVKLTQLTAFLNRRTIRPDIYAKIEHGVRAIRSFR